MANIEKFEQSLDQMIQLMIQMKQSLKEEAATPQVQAQAQAEPVPQPAQAISNLETFEQLKQALMSDKWPEAVNPNLICDPTSETDKTERSRGIIELMIEEDLKELKLLDVGCGEGYLTDLAVGYQTKLAVGYDIKENPSWAKFGEKPNRLLTTDFEAVKAQAPYDIIVIFDVLDHLQNETPGQFLGKIAPLLAPTGKIYMRCHPFISRHGTHLYHGLNKAYVHVIFTPEEIAQLNIDQRYVEPSVGVIYPLKTYSAFIAEGGLAIVNHREITEKVENFFKIPKIAERIMQTTKTNSFPEFQLGIQFVDYVLKRK